MNLLQGKSSWVYGAIVTISLILGITTNAYSRGGFGGGGGGGHWGGGGGHWGGGGGHWGGGGGHWGGGGGHWGGGVARWGGGGAHWGVNRWRGAYYGGGYWGGYPGYGLGAGVLGAGLLTGAVINSYNNGPSCYWTRGRDAYGVLRNFRVCN